MAMCSEPAPAPTQYPSLTPTISPSISPSIVPAEVPNLPCKPLDAIPLTEDTKRLLRILDYWFTRTTTINPSPSATGSPYTVTELVPCVEPSICAEGLININGKCYDLGYPECPRTSQNIADDALHGTTTYTVYVGQPCITYRPQYGATVWNLLETETRILPHSAHFLSPTVD